MVSCVEVVVRKNWNSGTSGDRVGPVGDMGVAPSSLILSFFFSKSLSAMVLRKMSCRVEFRAASEGKGYAAGDLIMSRNNFAERRASAVLSHYLILRVFLYLRRFIAKVAALMVLLVRAVEL